MESQVKAQAQAVSLSEAIQYAKMVDLADLLFKKAVKHKDKATQVNPKIQAYKDICDDPTYQGVVDPNFLTNYDLLYNLQMNDILLPQIFDPVYYGFIAQNKSTKDYVIAIRGTENWWEVVADLFFLPKPFTEFNNKAVVPSGFYDLYESGLIISPPDAATQIVPLLLKIVAATPALVMPDAPKVRTVVAGHSLGATLATYYAAAVASGLGNSLDLCVYTYASPKTGDAIFTDTYNKRVAETYRIFNKPDNVPNLPPSYTQVAGGYPIDSSAYSEVQSGAGCAHQLPVYQYTLQRLNGTDDQSILKFDTFDCSKA